ncbi:MAG: 2-C-methyl-D-erythritol 4-phosphate cytidylyltransferase [Pseudomonadota bacterium]
MSALWGVLPAAGSGSRFGAQRPKQFLELQGRSLLDWSVSALLDAVPLQGVVVAVAESEVRHFERSEVLADSRVSFCAGGDSRARSVANGLAALPAESGDWVLVHDAARPCVPVEDIRHLVQSVTATGVGGLLACRVTDTLKRESNDARVAETVDRKLLWRALTPQMFPVGALRDALNDALEKGVELTDEASAMERAGAPIQLVQASAVNIKVTYPEDLALASFWLERQSGEAA